VAAHLGALDALQAELETLCAGEWGALLSVRLQPSAAPAPVGVEAVLEWSHGALGPPGGAPGGTRAPALALATDSRYPLTQPYATLRGLPAGLASAARFERDFWAEVTAQPAPLSVTAFARAFLNAHAAALLS
jgi:hypothetical protein